MATKISHKVQEYQTLRPYLGNIPKKTIFPESLGSFSPIPNNFK